MRATAFSAWRSPRWSLEISQMLGLSRSVLSTAGLLALSIVGVVRADNRFWMNPAGGAFATPANWVGGIVPGPTDAAIFNMFSAAGYNVNFTSPRTVDRLEVRDDRVTLNLGGF